MKARSIALLPVLVCAAALASAAQAPLIGVILAVIASGLAFVGSRWELDLGRQLVTSAAIGGTGYALVGALREPLGGALVAGSLGEIWTRLAAALLLAAAARFPMLEPRGGRLGTTALAFASLMASGETSSAFYPLFVALFLATSLAALNVSEEASPATKLRASRVAVGAAVVLVAAGLALGTTVVVRRTSAWLTKRAHSTAYVWHPRVGFSEKMDLGALDGLLDSDRVVLRVRGPRVDYLRGVSLDTYEGDRWLRSDEADHETTATYDVPHVWPELVEVRAVGEGTGRFFLPLDMRSLVTAPAAVKIDSFGSVRRAAKQGLPVARFRRGARDGAPIAPPRRADLGVPRRIRQQLQVLALEWTAGATTPTGKLDAIERELLTHYRYSRNFERNPSVDPVLDFLVFERRGHCEYFATAFALVARAAGIPTRIVMGYRVGERSPFGYYVVRDRNAHAWIEAWVAGEGWTTRDATPSLALPQNAEHESGVAASSLDALSVGYDNLTHWLENLSVRQTAIAWICGVLALAFVVARGARRRRVKRELVPEDEAALPVLQRLLASLSKDGYSRRSDEPLERLAARVVDRDGAELLEKYAALRYGGIGRASELAKRVEAYETR